LILPHCVRGLVVFGFAALRAGSLSLTAQRAVTFALRTLACCFRWRGAL